MATGPLFAPTPFNAQAALSAANPNLDGTGTIVAIKTGSTNGAGFTRVDRIRLQALGATAAGMLRLFVKKNGGSWRLFKEIPVDAVTPGANTPAWSQEIDCSIPANVLFLLGGDQLGAAPHNAEAFVAHAIGGDT